MKVPERTAVLFCKLIPSVWPVLRLVLKADLFEPIGNPNLKSSNKATLFGRYPR